MLKGKPPCENGIESRLLKALIVNGRERMKG